MIKKTIVLLVILFCVSCKESAERITSTTVSVYLNESNCSIYEKIASGLLSDHQIIILESAPVYAFIKAREADELLLRFFLEKYQKKNGILTVEDREELRNIQNGHITWNKMAIDTQEFVSDLVFKGCSDNS